MGQCLTKDTNAFKTPSEFLIQNAEQPLSIPASSVVSSSIAESELYEPGKGTRSQLLRQVSAPSGIDTEDLTVIYRIPNEKYKVDKDVLTDRGIELLEKVDEGGFAKVYLSKVNGLKLACKMIDIGNDHDNIKLNDVKNELFVLEKVKHPHIIKMHQHFIINENLYIFMDFANSGNMFQFMQLHGPLPETIAKKPFAQIVSGVSYMHAKKIAHRDLKLSNILLNSDPEGNLQILIADFGLSRVVYRKKKGIILCKSYCGTPNYMAPELKKRQRYDAFKIDIYALGVMLFVILNCAYPFDVKEESKALQQMEQEEPDIKWSCSIKLSEDVKNLIKKLLSPKSNSRLLMSELIHSSWFKDDIEEIKHTLPEIEKLIEVRQVTRRLSSPPNDVRLEREMRRKSSPGNYNYVSRASKKNSTTNNVNTRSKSSKRESKSSKTSQVSKAKSQAQPRGRNVAPRRSSNGDLSSSSSSNNVDRERKTSSHSMMTTTLLKKPKQ